ncbi:MAG TPA: MmgE/PrpD family protein [Chloroflexota bacterium]|nr:MmgE/PrpD family protein [Chloroflexota bacterium]
MAGADRTERLAAYAAGFRYERLPAEAVEAAKLILLDTIGAILLGSQPMYAASRLTGDLARELGGTPECTVIGRGFKADAAAAALANGTMGYAADAEGGGILRQHAAAVMVPTALSVAEREHADGRSLIAALAVGYDVAARVDRASAPVGPSTRGWHPSAFLGHFGAAAVAGHLLKLDGARFANALGLAGLTAGGTAAWLNAEREDARAYVIGMAAHRGVLAALLAQAGMGAPIGILDEGKYSLYDAFTGAMRLEEVTKDLGEVFWIARHLGFKRYPCCGDIHPGIDAVIKIVTEHDLRPDDVVEIVDRVDPRDTRVPPLKSHCREYLLAVAAARREIAPDAILVDYREADWRVGDLYQRVRRVPDPATAALGGYGPAVVEVRTRDGRLFRETVLYRLGHPANPLSPVQLEEKFFRWATTRIPRDRAERVREVVGCLEELPDVAGLVALLAAPE